jgi:hypothetical protein
MENIQNRLPDILGNAIKNQSLADANEFTLCQLSGFFSL